jgi:hypothetical protein
MARTPINLLFNALTHKLTPLIVYSGSTTTKGYLKRNVAKADSFVCEFGNIKCLLQNHCCSLAHVHCAESAVPEKSHEFNEDVPTSIL